MYEYIYDDDMSHVKVNGKDVEYDWNGNSCTDYMNTDIPVMSLKVPTTRKEADLYYKRIMLEVDNMKVEDSLEIPFMGEYAESMFKKHNVVFSLPGYSKMTREMFPNKKIVEAPENPDRPPEFR